MKINFKELSEYSLYERAKRRYFKPIDFNCKYLIDGLHFPRDFTDPDKDILLKMEALYNFDKDTKVLLINDLGLQWVYELNKKYGITIFHILCVRTAYLKRDFIKICIEHQITNMYNMEDIKIIPVYLEEMKEMNKKFDIVIANPPYSCGNEIIDSIIKNIDFNIFINLMPLSKYKSNNLYNYIIERIPGVNCYDKEQNSFENAATSPDICILSKNKLHNWGYKDFELFFQYDYKLKKFWEENSRRPLSYLEGTYMYPLDKIDSVKASNSFAVGIYAPHNKVHPLLNLKTKFNNKNAITEFLNNNDKKISRDCSEEYIWNFIKPDCNFTQCFSTPASTTSVSQTIIIFKTELEKDNFVKWWYSAELNGRDPKSGLTSILLAGLNKPTSCPFNAAIPNVDWTREWTDKGILKDYGYSDEEIERILKLGENNLYGRTLQEFDF